MRIFDVRLYFFSEGLITLATASSIIQAKPKLAPPNPPPLPGSASPIPELSQSSLPVPPPPPLPVAAPTTPQQLSKILATSQPQRKKTPPTLPSVQKTASSIVPTLPTCPGSAVPPVPPPLPIPEPSELAMKASCPPPRQVLGHNNWKDFQGSLTRYVADSTSHTVPITEEYHQVDKAVQEEAKDDRTDDFLIKEDSPVSVKNMVEKLSKLYSTNYQGKESDVSKAGKPSVPIKQPALMSRIACPQGLKPPTLRLRSPTAQKAARSSPSPPPAPPRTSSLTPIPQSPPSSVTDDVSSPIPSVSTPVIGRRSFRAAPPPPVHPHQDGVHGERETAASSVVTNIHGQVSRKYSFRAAPPPPGLLNHVKSANNAAAGSTALASKLQTC